MHQVLPQKIQYAFDLQSISDRIKSKHMEILREKEKQEAKLSISKLLSINGRSILHLFGYHLAQKVGDSSFSQVGKKRTRVWVLEEEFNYFMKIFWPDLNQYETVLPVLYSILKDRGAVYLKDIDMFVQISRKSISPFIAEIKQSIGPIKLQELIRKIQKIGERQDILETGYIEKLVIEELFKKQVSKNVPKWPKQLIGGEHENKINYKLLLNDQFLLAGHQIEEYLYGHLIKKIVKLLKLAAPIVKSKKKTGRKLTTARKKKGIGKTKVKEIINQFIETNKPTKIQDPSKTKYITKSLIYDLIDLTVCIAENQEKPMVLDQDSVKKSIYITEPTLAEIQHEENDISLFSDLCFTESSGLGVLISNTHGQIIDPIHQKKGASFTLQPSRLLKQSPIISFEIQKDIIYLLQENGLLYSWKINQQAFQNHIQTSLKSQQPDLHPKNITKQSYLKISDGIIFINCTHCEAGLIEFYQQSNLNYIGCTTIQASDYKIKPEFLEQSLELSSKLSGKVPIDLKIHSIEQYQKLLTDYKFEQKKGTNIGEMLCKYYEGEHFTINELEYITKYILEYQKSVKIIFPQSIHQKIENGNYTQFSQDELQYLKKLGYISESSPEHIDEFVREYDRFVEREINRKQRLLALFEDNNLLELSDRYMTIHQFKHWIAPACLMKHQMSYLIDNQLKFTPNGLINMKDLVINEHYNRIIDYRRQRYLPQNYKLQYLPPPIINQIQPSPALQIFVYTMKFPIQSTFYIGSLVTGRVLSKIDLSKFTHKDIIVGKCPKNDYYTVIAGSTLQIWSKKSISQFNGEQLEQMNPSRQWVEIQTEQILSAKIVYESNTLLTLTSKWLKVWDLDQMFSHKYQRPVFTIKPGYKAIQKNSKSGDTSYKKKILFRGEARQIYSFKTPNCLNIISILSSKANTLFIKSFYINKFHVMISNKAYYEQIPTKLIREFQKIAERRKRLPPVSLQARQFSESQENVIGYIISKFKDNLEASSTKKIVANSRENLTRKINQLSTNLCNLYTTKNMFIEADDKNRFQLIFDLLTSPTKKSASSILRPDFLAIYTDSQTSDYSYKRLTNDCLTLKQVKTVNRILYFLSLIEKYTRPYVQQSEIMLIKLISIDRNKLDETLIREVLPTQLPLEVNIISKSIKLINSFKMPLKTAVLLIKNYIPTRYRFLCPRYLKQVTKNKPSPQLSQYLSNRYQIAPSGKQLQKIQHNLTHNDRYSSINQFISQNSLYSFIAQEIIPLSPSAKVCNYALIEYLMAYKQIDEKEAIYFTLQQTKQPSQRFSTKQQKPNTKLEYNKIGYKIASNISINNINLPKPSISLEFFKDNMYDEQYQLDFFYHYLKGSREKHTVLTENVLLMLDLISKKLSIKYDYYQFETIMNYKNTNRYTLKLKANTQQLIARVPRENRIMTAIQFKGVLMNFIDKQEDYEELTVRSAYACTGDPAKKQQWHQRHMGKTGRPGTEGMWININYILKYIAQYNPYLTPIQVGLSSVGAIFSNKFISNPQQISIPSYFWYKILQNQQRFLHIHKFREILTRNIHPLKLIKIEQIINSIYRYQMKTCFLSDLNQSISDVFKFNRQVIGEILINKYHRSDYQYKFTIVSDHVATKQVIQLIGSKTLVINLFAKSDSDEMPEFIDYQTVMKTIRYQCIKPSIQKYITILIAKTETEIFSLLQYQLKQKSPGTVAVSSVGQLLEEDHCQAGILLCILRYIAEQNDNALVLGLERLIDNVKNYEANLKIRENYQQYRRALKEVTQQQNPVDLFLKYAKSLNYPLCPELKPEQYLVVQQHIKDLLSKKKQLSQYWYINYCPSTNITGFLDHLYPEWKHSINLKKVTQFFTDQCVQKIGIQILMQKLGKRPTFAHFYNRLKSQTKNITKFNTMSYLALYNQIKYNSPVNEIEQIGIMKTIQLHISIEKKMQWICSLYDRERIVQPLDNEELFIETQYKIQKVKLLSICRLVSEGQLQMQINAVQYNKIVNNCIKKSLSYGRYLIMKYLGDDIGRIEQINRGIVDHDHEGVRRLLMMAGIHNEFHMQEITKYIEDNYEQFRKISQPINEELTINTLQTIIQQINEHCENINYPILLPHLEQQNKQYSVPKWHQSLSSRIRQSKVYYKYQYESPTSKYYNTYHSLLQYSKTQLQKCYGKPQYRQTIIHRLQDFCLRNNISLTKIYALFDFSNYDSIVCYLPYCLILNQDREIDLMREWVKELFKKNPVTGIEIKYPITVSEFWELLLNDSGDKEPKKTVEEAYHKLDIMGVGYVNLNDVEEYRGINQQKISPYIRISTYLNQLSNTQSQKSILHFFTKQINYYSPQSSSDCPIPPSDPALKSKIKQKLSKFQSAISQNRKYSLIDKQMCLAVFGEFGLSIDHNFIQFMTQSYEIRSYQQLNLSGVLNWLYQFKGELEIHEENRNQNDKLKDKIEAFTEEVEELGIYGYTEKIIKGLSIQEIKEVAKGLYQLNPDPSSNLVISIGVHGNPKVFLSKLVGNIVDYCYQQYRGWNTRNNDFCQMFKNMSQLEYSLINKFYNVHKVDPMHWIYHQISTNGQLTFFTLWQHIEQKGITGYSRAQVQQLFDAIDINGDKSIQANQFNKFWMAAEQIFRKANNKDSDLSKNSPPIDALLDQIKLEFLRLCLIDLDSIHTEELSLVRIQQLLNIENVDKIDRVFRAITSKHAEEDIGSGAVDASLKLYRSKIKIMTDSLKKNIVEGTDSKKYNHLLDATIPEIQQYMGTLYTKEAFCKFMMAKFPNLGYRILQQLNQFTSLHITNIKQYYLKSTIIRYQNTNNKQKRDSLEIGERLIRGIEQFSRKNTIKTVNYHHEGYGCSLARALIDQQAKKLADINNKETEQIVMFLTKLKQFTNQIGYDAEQDITFEANQVNQNKELIEIQQHCSQMILKEGGLIPFQLAHTVESSKFIIRRGVSTDKTFIQRKIEWKDTNFVCKSDNKVNLLQMAPLYNDPRISLIGLQFDKTQNTRFKIIGYGMYNSQQQYQPLILKEPINHSIDSIMKLIQGIVDQLYYCYNKYSVTGLLLIPQNALVNKYDHSIIKFDHFLTSLSVDLTSVNATNGSRVTNNMSSGQSIGLNTVTKEKSRNYVDGINSSAFVEDQQNYPPEIDSGVYNEAIDVYQLVHLIYTIFGRHLYPNFPYLQGLNEKTKGISTDQQSIWHQKSILHQLSFQILSNPQSHVNLSEKQKLFWGLMYQCSYYEWYMRPKLYQVKQVVDNYFSLFVDEERNISEFRHDNSREQGGPLLIFKQKNFGETILDYLLSMQYKVVDQLMESKDSYKGWNLQQLIQYCQQLKLLIKNQERFPSDTNIGNLFKHYNIMLQEFIKNKSDQISELQNAKQFLENMADYLFIPKANNSALCFLTLSAYKTVLNCKQVKSYLVWSDQNWKIDEFIISKKLEQVNMVNRLGKLHKSSSYYHDLTTLAECRAVLSATTASDKTNTSQKVAISFVHSSIISNNINKVYAVYKSQILKTLYLSINIKNASSTSMNQQQNLVLQIYEKISECLNPQKHLNRFKAVNQVYKIMMVIFNIVNTHRKSKQSPRKPGTQSQINKIKNNSSHRSSFRTSKNITKTNKQQTPNQLQKTQNIFMSPVRTLLQSGYQFSLNLTKTKQEGSENKIESSSIISMLDFMNNYYTLGGEECRQVIMLIICNEQLFTYPALLYLLSIETMNSEHQKLMRSIINNISYSHRIEKMMRSSVIGDYQQKIKTGYLTGSKNKESIKRILQQVQKNTSFHKETVTICQLSTFEFKKEAFAQFIDDHIKFYSWYTDHYTKVNPLENIPHKYKSNTHQYMLGFLSRCQKICESELPLIQDDHRALEIVQMIVKAHKVMFDLWACPPSHIDYVAATIRFLMKTLQQVYSEQQLYLQNKAHGSITPNLLYLLNQLWHQGQNANYGSKIHLKHNLIRIAIDNGYLHFYCRIVKKQHSLLLKFIDKNVENIHLIDNYPVEAEFRLINFYNLLVRDISVEYRTEIQQILLRNNFVQYIFEKMFVNQVYMDLRFFRSTNIDIVPYRFCNPLKSEAITMIGFILNSQQNISIRSQFISRVIPHLLESAQILTNWNKAIHDNLIDEADDRAVMKVIETFWLLANLCDCDDHRLKYQIINLQINEIIKELISSYVALAEFFPKLMDTVYS